MGNLFLNIGRLTHLGGFRIPALTGKQGEHPQTYREEWLSAWRAKIDFNISINTASLETPAKNT